MKFTKLLLLVPCLMFSAALFTGCSETAQENTVIEAPDMTEEEEAQYEKDSYGDTEDEAQN